MGIVSTKTFKSRDGVAVNLPEAASIGPDTIRPIKKKDPAEEKRRLLDLVAKLRALHHPPYVEERDPIEFPERPGLY